MDIQRLIDLISNEGKEYIADFVLGISSNTQDITGKLSFHSDSTTKNLVRLKKLLVILLVKSSNSA